MVLYSVVKVFPLDTFEVKLRQDNTAQDNTGFYKETADISDVWYETTAVEQFKVFPLDGSGVYNIGDNIQHEH